MEQGLAAFRTARLIAWSLPIGVLLFWAIAWFVTDGGENALRPGALPPDIATWVWAAVALAGFLGAFLFRGRALQAVDAAGMRASAGATRASASDGYAAVESNLVIAWALLELPALIAGVLFLLLGDRSILLGGACVYLMGMVLTFPRAPWFGVGEGR